MIWIFDNFFIPLHICQSREPLSFIRVDLDSKSLSKLFVRMKKIEISKLLLAAVFMAAPAAARPPLPALVSATGVVICPILGGPAFAAADGARTRALFLDRFKAATGFFDQECVT